MSSNSRIISMAGNTQTYIMMDRLANNMRVGGCRGLQSCCKLVVKTAQDGIKNPPKSGVKYPRLRVRSSSAGEYPANQTGKLRRGMGYQMQGQTRAYVGNRVHYSRFLNNGTRYMKPRPFMDMSMKENVNKMPSIIDQAIRRTI